MRPRVFVGSSSEGLDVAYSLQSSLEQDGEISVWTQNIFQPTEYVLENLLTQLDGQDVGVFVFTPDDLLQVRGAEHKSARDNVVFEFGLFVGRLGREHCYIVAPRGADLHLPSDLLGIGLLQYDAARQDGNLQAALGPAADRIRRQLRRVLPRSEQRPAEFDLPLMERRDLLTTRQRRILNVIDAHQECTFTTLSAELDNIPRSELFYRLEQLRLLMFVRSKRDTSTADGDVVYSLALGYLRAQAKRRAEPLGSAPPSPFDVDVSAPPAP